MPAVSSKIEHKTLAFKVETVDDDQGIITGYLSTFDNIDLGNGYICDRVRSGAFKRTIAHAIERKATKGKKYLWPHLWMHGPEQPIGGYIDAKEDTKGLLVAYQLDISKNSAGIPNNPTATMVFSGYKHGYIDEQSIGYEVIKSELVEEVVDGKKTMVRDLLEIRLWEGSSITSNFAMNPEATVTGVKSVASDALATKTVCGNTSGPLGPRDESWDDSKAEKQIWAAAEKEDGSITASVAKKYFMVCDGESDKKGSYSYPFWYLEPEPHICVGAVIAIAGAIGGARGASAPSGLKGKVKTLYSRINRKYPDAEQLTPKWEDAGKARRPMDKKDFHDNYRDRQIRDWCSELYSITSAFRETCEDAFKMGDQPLEDILAALNGNDDSPGFIDEVQKWVQEGIELDYSNYLEEMQENSSYSPYSYGLMARDGALSSKAGRAISAANAEKIQAHIDDLHTKADAYLKAAKSHVKAIHGAAESMADMIGMQGDDHDGDEPTAPDEGNQEGKHAQRTPSRETRTTQPRPSPEDTVAEDEIQAALAELKALKPV